MSNPENIHTLHLREAFELFSTNPTTGLSSEEAKLRLTTYGYNRLEKEKSTPIILRFFKQFADFMIIILIYPPMD